MTVIDRAPVHGAPLWSSLALLRVAEGYDRVARPALGGLALISATTTGLGFFHLYPEPSLETFVRSLALGMGMWLILRTFWAGAWCLPELDTRGPLCVYALVAVLGFVASATVSFMGTQHFAAGVVSQDLAESDATDALANRGQEIVAHVEQLGVVAAALARRRDQAAQAARDERAGNGPTGIPGAGSVYNAFLAARSRYAEAATLVESTRAEATALSSKVGESIAALRRVQDDTSLGRSARTTQLRTLRGETIGQLRALLALDPARAVEAAAAIVATGVPAPSWANPASLARIAEIRGALQTQANAMRGEAKRLAATAPALPALQTQSEAQHLLANLWRLPGLTIAALLFDLCGWVAIGFRVALYAGVRARREAELARPGPSYVTLEELVRLEQMAHRLEETRRHLDASRAAVASAPVLSDCRAPNSGETDV